MSASTAVSLRGEGVPDLLAPYAEHVNELPIGVDAKRVRRSAARALLDLHPDLHAWMTRPMPARLADLRRTKAWPFLSWCLVEGHLVADLDLMLAKQQGDLYATWAARHPEDVDRFVEVAQRFAWSATWTRQVSVAGLALLCLLVGKRLAQLEDDDFALFAQTLRDAPTVTRAARQHNQARLFSLHQACYELGLCQTPPRRARPAAATLAEQLQAIPQPEIRRIAQRYLEVVAATLRPSTVGLRADSLIVFAEYLAHAHPEVASLTQLDRHGHIEPFLIWNDGRPWRGHVARDRPVSASVSTPRGRPARLPRRPRGVGLG